MQKAIISRPRPSTCCAAGFVRLSGAVTLFVGLMCLQRYLMSIYERFHRNPHKSAGKCYNTREWKTGRIFLTGKIIPARWRGVFDR